MKKYLILWIFFLIGNQVQAQFVLGNLSSNPDNYVLYDINSSKGGFLLPRIEDTTAILSPERGLLIYSKQKAYPLFYDGQKWQPFLSLPNKTFSIQGSTSGSQVFMTFQNTNESKSDYRSLEINRIVHWTNLLDQSNTNYEWNSLILGKNTQPDSAARISFIRRVSYSNSMFMTFGFYGGRSMILKMGHNSDASNDPTIVLNSTWEPRAHIGTSFAIESGNFRFEGDANNQPGLGKVLQSDALGNATWVNAPLNPTPSFSQTVLINFNSYGPLNNVYNTSMSLNTNLTSTSTNLANQGISLDNATNTITFTGNKYLLEFALGIGGISAPHYQGPITFNLRPTDDTEVNGKSLQVECMIFTDGYGSHYVSGFKEFYPLKNIPYKLTLSVPANSTQSLALNKINLNAIKIH